MAVGTYQGVTTGCQDGALGDRAFSRVCISTRAGVLYTRKHIHVGPRFQHCGAHATSQRAAANASWSAAVRAERLNSGPAAAPVN